jgi:hypothetical protein
MQCNIATTSKINNDGSNDRKVLDATFLIDYLAGIERY